MNGTERLVLRPPVPGDVAAFFAIFGDPRTNAHNPAGPCADIVVANQMLTVRIAHWRRHGFGQWTISSRERPEVAIGFGGLAWRDYAGIERLNLGYRFGVDAWGRGYATEFGVVALRYAFETLREPAVYAVVRPSNVASVRVLEKIGMQRAGDLDDVPGYPRSYVYRAASTSG